MVVTYDKGARQANVLSVTRNSWPKLSAVVRNTATACA